MPLGLVLDLARDALNLTMALASPLLSTALVVGLIISILQAVTSVQEQTLSFVPKLFAVGGIFLVLLSWMLNSLMQYTTELFRALPGFVG